MRYCVHLTVFLLCAFALSGCSQKYVSVQTIAPAQFENALQYKSLRIVPSPNDAFHMAHFLEEKLFEKSFNGKQLFQLVPASQKQPSSSVVDAYIVMQMDPPIIFDTPYYVERIRCNDSKCKYAYTVYVPCVERHYSTAIHFQMIDAKNSHLIVSKSFSKGTQDRVCYSGGYERLPDTQFHLGIMQERIVNEFVALISPTYHTINARLALKEPEIDLDSTAQKMLEEGIEDKPYEPCKGAF